MKLLTDLNALLAELQTWTDSRNQDHQDHQVAALKSFATRAKEIIGGPDNTITVDLPAGDKATRKLVCQAINQCLEGRGVYYQTTGRHFTVFPDAPKEAPAPVPPPLFPLGPNRTAGGQEARVICNDASAQGCPVVAEITSAVPHSHRIAYFTKTGEAFTGDPNDRLVGHLPPEPVKPREFWLTKTKLSHGNWTVITTQPDLDSRYDTVRVREVLPHTGKQYHAWVRDSDGEMRSIASFDERSAEDMDYRKAILIEATP